MLTNSSAEGYCGATELGGDCTTDSTGAWALSRAQAASWDSAWDACSELCRSCQRCKFMSVSLQHRDCSWFYDCDLAQLSNAVRSFRSRVAPAANAYRRPNASALLFTGGASGTTLRPLQTSMRNGEGLLCGKRAALLVSGTVKGRGTDAGALSRYVVEPLRRALAPGELSLFVCTEPSSADDAFVQRLLSWPGAYARLVAAPDQHARRCACLSSLAREPSYDLYVAMRPDLLWSRPVDVPTLDRIALRARVLYAPPHVAFVHPLSLSVTPDPCSWVARGPIECSVLDDAFALVPRAHAQAYFCTEASLERGFHRRSEAEVCGSVWPRSHFNFQEKHLTSKLWASQLPLLIYPFAAALTNVSSEAQCGYNTGCHLRHNRPQVNRLFGSRPSETCRVHREGNDVA